jgi:hypothetical protein
MSVPADGRPYPYPCRRARRPVGPRPHRGFEDKAGRAGRGHASRRPGVDEVICRPRLQLQALRFRPDFAHLTWLPLPGPQLRKGREGCLGR